jgi:hypothetical protein
MRSVPNDIRVLQWFLDLPKLQEIMGWPVGAERLVASGQDIHRLSKQEPGDAEEIAKAWNRLGGAIGPNLLGTLMSCDHWRELVPPVAGQSYDDEETVWMGGGKSVVARMVYDKGRPINVGFEVR